MAKQTAPAPLIDIWRRQDDGPWQLYEVGHDDSNRYLHRLRINAYSNWEYTSVPTGAPPPS